MLWLRVGKTGLSDHPYFHQKMQAKEAKIRAAKVEEEVADLVKKAQQLEVELDKTKEELSLTTEKLKEKENNLLSAELEVNALNRRVQALEGDLETCEDKLLVATQKLDKAATAADDSDRMRKVLENRAVQDEDRMGKLEEELKSAKLYRRRIFNICFPVQNKVLDEHSMYKSQQGQWT